MLNEKVIEQIHNQDLVSQNTTDKYYVSEHNRNRCRDNVIMKPKSSSVGKGHNRMDYILSRGFMKQKVIQDYFNKHVDQFMD